MARNKKIGNGKLSVIAAVLAILAVILAAGQYLRTEKKPELPPAVAKTVKVVYHADFADPRRFSAMLTSINNMVTTYQSDLV